MIDNLIMYTNEDLKYLANKIQDAIETLEEYILPVEDEFNEKVIQHNESLENTYKTKIEPEIKYIIYNRETVWRDEVKYLFGIFPYRMKTPTESFTCDADWIVPNIKALGSDLGIHLHVYLRDDYYPRPYHPMCCYEYLRRDACVVIMYDQPQTNNQAYALNNELNTHLYTLQKYISENKTVGLTDQFVTQINDTIEQVKNFDISIYKID